MSKLIRKFFAIATSLTVLAMMVSVSPAKALTAEELQAQINQLMATLTSLQAQLADLEGGGTTPSGTVPAACVGMTFDRALKQGMSGSDVKCLQALLNTDADTKLADSGAGSPGNETTYFGPITKAGAIKFQEKYASSVLAPWGLTTGTGYIGSTTREKLNSILASGTGNGTGPDCTCTSWASAVCGTGACTATQRQQTRTCTPSACASESQCVADSTCQAGVPSTGVRVSLDAGTPAARVVAKGAYDLEFAKLKFTAGSDQDYKITKLIIKRGGVSEDDDVSEIKLFEGATKVGSTQAINTTTHKVTFQGLSWTIPAGASKVLTIKATIDATNGTTGNAVSFGIASASDVIVEGGGAVEGAPVYGHAMTISGASVGVLDVDMAATPAAGDVISGATDQHVATLQFTASSVEGFDITYLKLTEVGTSAAGDVKNVKLKYVGEQVGPTVAEVSSDEEAVFTGDPILSVKAGTTKNIDVYVDVSSDVRSERTIKVEITDAEDLTAVGQNSGGAVVITHNSGSTYAAEQSAAQTIKQGTMTVTFDAATNPSATSYVIGYPQAKISSFKFSAGSQEGVKVTKLRITQGGTIASSEYQNVQIYVDGSETSTGLVGSISGSVVTLRDADGLFTVPKGGNTVVTVKSDISSSADDTDTLIFYIAALTDITMKGLDSDAKIDSDASHLTITAVDTAAEASTQTVVGNGNLTISSAPDTPAGKNLTKGQTGIEILRFRLAAEYEDMTVSSIKVRTWDDATVAQNTNDTATTLTTYAQNIKLYDGSTLLKEVSTPSEGYVNFNTNLTVKKDQTKTLRVVLDIPTTSALTYLAGTVGAKEDGTTDLTAAAELTTTGVSSAQDITETGYAIGNVFTLRTPTLAVDSSAYPPASNPYIVSNTAEAHIARMVLTGSYEDIKVTRVKVSLTGDSSLYVKSSAEDIFTNLKLKVGSTQIGSTKQLTDGVQNKDYATFDSISNLTVLKDQQIYLDIYADVTATSSASDNISWYAGVASTGDIVGSGLFSNTSVSSTGATKASNAIKTLSSGTLTISVDADTPTAKNVAVGVGGVSGLEFTKLKFEADFEDMLVKTLKFTLSYPDATTTAGAYDFNKVYLYDGTTKLAEAVVDPTALTVLFTNDTGLFTVSNGVAKVITVKGDVRGIGTGVLSEDAPKFYITQLQDDTRVVAEGVSSNASTTATDGTPNPETATNINSQYLYRTKITVAKNAACPSGTQSPGAAVEVFRFDVTADSAADAVVNTVTVDVSGTADLSGASGNASLYKSTDLTNPLATETYKVITLPSYKETATSASTTAVTSSDGAFDGIPAGATVHIYDTSGAVWDTAKVVGVDGGYGANRWDRLKFDHALAFSVSGTDIIYYKPLQPGEGKLYFGAMAVLEANTTVIASCITVDDATGFATGDNVKLWGYTSAGAATNTPVALVVATTSDYGTAHKLCFDSKTGVAIDYNYDLTSATDAYTSRALAYTSAALNNVEETVAAGTTKTFVVKGDTTGAASTKTISIGFDSASDIIWGDNPTWTDGVTKYINARTDTFPAKTTLSY